MLKMRTLFVILTVTYLTAAGAAIYFKFGKTKRKLGQENAVWTESIYLRGHQPSTGEKLTDKHIAEYAAILKKHGIKYAYFYAGPIGQDGHLPSFVFSDTARSTVQKFKALYPELVILPWCGGIQHKTIYLEDSIWRATAISDLKQMVNTLQVPGVHVDFEYFVPKYQHLDPEVLPGDSLQMAAYPYQVNQFHKQLRDSLPKAFISSVVTSTCPASNHWKRKTSLKELEGLLPYIDQLNFLFYDMDIHDTTVFYQSADQQLKDLQTIKSKYPVQLLLSIATFINPPQFQEFHDPAIESIEHTLNTLRMAETDISPDHRLIDGISIYSGWETNIKEWHKIAHCWTRYNNE